MRVRQATAEDVPSLVALFQELDRMQADWRVFTPRPGFYDEVGAKYNEALADPDTVVLVAEDEDGEVVGMAYGEARTPSRFSDERALELSGVVVRAGYRGRGRGSGARARGRPFRGRPRGSVARAQDLRPQPWRDGVLGGPRVQRPGGAAHEPHEDPARAARGALASPHDRPAARPSIGGARERTGPPVGSNERHEPRARPRRGRSYRARRGAMADSAYRGARIRELPRANRTYPGGRVCAAEGCSTKLSIYNRWESLLAARARAYVHLSRQAQEPQGDGGRVTPRYAPSPRKPSRAGGRASGLGRTSHQGRPGRARQLRQNRSPEQEEADIHAT